VFSGVASGAFGQHGLARRVGRAHEVERESLSGTTFPNRESFLFRQEGHRVSLTSNRALRSIVHTKKTEFQADSNQDRLSPIATTGHIRADCPSLCFSMLVASALTDRISDLKRPNSTGYILKCIRFFFEVKSVYVLGAHLLGV
jgi:hypothetical protein